MENLKTLFEIFNGTNNNNCDFWWNFVKVTWVRFEVFVTRWFAFIGDEFDVDWDFFFCAAVNGRSQYWISRLLEAKIFGKFCALWQHFWLTLERLWERLKFGGLDEVSKIVNCCKFSKNRQNSWPNFQTLPAYYLNSNNYIFLLNSIQYWWLHSDLSSTCRDSVTFVKLHEASSFITMRLLKTLTTFVSTGLSQNNLDMIKCLFSHLFTPQWKGLYRWKID